jgi:hypothetical protein
MVVNDMPAAAITDGLLLNDGSDPARDSGRLSTCQPAGNLLTAS